MRSQPTADRAAAAADQDTLKFRAPTLDEAVAAAEEALGGRVKVLEANKIRRGGIGGFFASDLGVEVTVVPEDETIEQALERLVAQSDAEERNGWTDRAPRMDAATLTADDEIEDDDIVVDIPAPEMSMKALRKMGDLSMLPPAAPPTPAVVPTVEANPPRASRRLQKPSEMVSAQDIVAELRSLTSDPSVSFDRVQQIADLLSPAPAEEAKPAPRLASPSRKKLVSPAASKFAEAAAIITTEQPVVETLVIQTPVIETPVIETPVIETPVMVAPIIEVPVVAETPVVIVTPSLPIIETRIETNVGTSVDVVPAAAVEVMPAAPRVRPAGAPSRRHVELTLAAADQLIDSLSRTGKVQRLSVRVVLRSGDQREVEAEAQWESAAPISASSTEAA